MDRGYALRRLLEHGPLTLRELVEITRWKEQSLAATLRWEQDYGVIQKRREKVLGERRIRYELAQ